MSTDPKGPHDTLLNASTDELFELLGRDLAGAQAFPSSSEELIQEAKDWFSAQSSKIEGAICTPTVAKIFVAECDKRELLIALADLLAEIQLGVAPLTLAALLLKMGLKNFCKWP